MTVTRSVSLPFPPEVVRTWVLAAGTVLRHEMTGDQTASGLTFQADWGLGDTDSIRLEVLISPHDTERADLVVVSRWRPLRIPFGNEPLQEMADALLQTVEGFATAAANGMEVPDSPPPAPLE